MSIERRKLLAALGAELVLTEPTLGMRGVLWKSNRIHTAFQMRSCHNNLRIPLIQRYTTRQQLKKFGKIPNGNVDIFIAAVGTGGTITGTGKRLKELNPNIKIIAVEPDASPVLSGGKPGPHKIQGIGAGFVPSVLDTHIYDEIIQVSYENSVATSRNLAKDEGVLVGISAGKRLCRFTCSFASRKIKVKPSSQFCVIQVESAI